MEFIEFVMGDWSNDGHNMTSRRKVKSNLSKKEIEIAYKVATEKLGFDFSQTACADYECQKLTSQQVQALNDNGVVCEGGANYDYVDDDVYLELYLQIIKLGNPIFTYTIVQSPSINIGGYGLFYDG